MQAYFTLDNPKREKSTIRGNINYQGKKYKYSTGESIKVSMFKNQRCKACPEAGAINNKIMAVKAAMESTILFFKQDFKIPSQEEFSEKVSQFLKGNNHIQIKRNEKLFIPYIGKYIERSKMSENTKKGYVTTLNKIKEYQAYKGKEYSFDDITLKFEEEFKNWLLESTYTKDNQKFHYSKNYIGAIFKNIMLFMRDAMDIDKLHSNDDYKRFSSESETADSVYLSIPELEAIHRLQITEESLKEIRRDFRPQNIEASIKSLTLVKNKFLIGAFCAMRISDFNRITEMNIDNEVIRIMPKKGSSLRKPDPVNLPMHPIVKEILDSGFNVFESISSQKINEHIKEVCRLAGIKDKITLYRTEGTQLVERSCEKWEAVTSHTARRSGATNMWLDQMPIELIMACGGWQKQEQCEKYIKASVNDKLEALKKSNYFIGWRQSIEIKDITSEWVILQMKRNNMSTLELSNRLNIEESVVKDTLQGDLTAWSKAAFYYLFTKSS
ncbi:MAG: hypothetical protein EGP82_00335 [Odoribacter splanchnicus]|nr:hypothetical protein [Odoribacter splanchnicus]